MAQTKLMSLNVRGLNSPMKRMMLAQEIDMQGADLVFLQETHYMGEFKPKLRSKLIQASYYSKNVRQKSRGVAILIASTAAFTEISVKTDPRALKAHRSVQLTRGSFYTQGNKSGRLLARALKTKHQRSSIDKTGKQCNTTDDIATAFSTFYKDLYNLDPPSKRPNNLREYITSNLPHTIPNDTALTLDEPFSPAELSLAIKTLPKRQEPRPRRNDCEILPHTCTGANPSLS
ncbi:Hypothetical predicted protein [Pelobates cultripes]|nr:Hypothetical predicted protein [Pelobates cultripes]